MIPALCPSDEVKNRTGPVSGACSVFVNGLVFLVELLNMAFENEPGRGWDSNVKFAPLVHEDALENPVDIFGVIADRVFFQKCCQFLNRENLSQSFVF